MTKYALILIITVMVCLTGMNLFSSMKVAQTKIQAKYADLP